MSETRPQIKIDIHIPQYAINFDKKILRKALRGAGQEVAAVARALIRNSQGTGPRGVSLPGQPPVNRSGTLAGSIKAKVLGGGLVVDVRDYAPYALALEVGAFGGGGNKGSGKGRSHKKRTAEERKAAALGRGETRELEARPYLSTALEQREASIAERIRAAVVDGIEFKKVKP